MRTYRDELDWAYHGEVYGEAMFDALAEVAGDGERATQLRLMTLIERQTRQQLAPLCDREGIARRDDDLEAKGRAFAERARKPAWDWDRFLSTFAPLTEEALVRYRLMRSQLAPEGDAAVMGALVRHEEVLQSYADGLIAGSPDAAAPLVSALEGEHRAEADRLLGTEPEPA
jgi:hypothetical protein